MKKIILIMLALTLAYSLSSCAYRAAKPIPGTAPAVNWKDGTYDGKGDKWEYGDESATVLVSDSKIEHITLRKLTGEGQEVNYEEWTGKEFRGQVRPNLKQFKEALAKAISAKQSTEVDDISGATISSKNWKLAIERALEQAEVK